MAERASCTGPRPVSWPSRPSSTGTLSQTAIDRLSRPTSASKSRHSNKSGFCWSSEASAAQALSPKAAAPALATSATARVLSKTTAKWREINRETNHRLNSLSMLGHTTDLMVDNLREAKLKQLYESVSTLGGKLNQTRRMADAKQQELLLLQRELSRQYTAGSGRHGASEREKVTALQEMVRLVDEATEEEEHRRGQYAHMARRRREELNLGQVRLDEMGPQLKKVEGATQQALERLALVRGSHRELIHQEQTYATLTEKLGQAMQSELQRREDSLVQVERLAQSASSREEARMRIPQQMADEKFEAARCLLERKTANLTELSRRKRASLSRGSLSRGRQQLSEEEYSAAREHGQNAVWPPPKLGACASSGCSWRLWAVRHSHG